MTDRRWALVGTTSFFLWLAVLYFAVRIVVGLAAEPTTIQGDAHVIDGDTIVVGTTRVRLFGIDAPELHQTCGMPWGTEACGEDARRALEGLIAGRPVICLQSDTDRYGRADGGCLRCEADAGEACRPPLALDTIARLVLAYRPKPKSAAAKKRKRRATKIAKDRA